MACSQDPNQNMAKAEWRIREAAGKGAQIVCLQELFRSQYFCMEEKAERFDLAEPVPGPSTDALGRLALEGLVIRKARAGTTVSPLDIIELRQAYEARTLIEPHCAALAARHASSEDLACLARAFDGAEAAVRARDSRALVAMDQRFHASIARASRNATLARIIIPLQHKAARFWIYSMDDDTEEERIEEINRHMAVAACIAQGDAERARTMMLEVLGTFSDNMRRAAMGIAGGAVRPPGLSIAAPD